MDKKLPGAKLIGRRKIFNLYQEWFKYNNFLVVINKHELKLTTHSDSNDSAGVSFTGLVYTLLKERFEIDSANDKRLVFETKNPNWCLTKHQVENEIVNFITNISNE